MSTRSKNPKPNNIASRCVATRIRMLNRAISSIYDASLRPYGMTVAQMNILVTISNESLLSPRDLAQALVMEKSTVSRNIERMKLNGWVRVRPGSDNRMQRLKLTRRGADILERASEGWAKAQRIVSRMIGRESVGVLDDICMRVAAESQAHAA